MKQTEKTKVVKLGSGITTIQERNANGTITVKVGKSWR
jgi:hypothetical protein